MRLGKRRLQGHPSLSLTVAQHLCQVGQFRVPLGRQQALLRVSPYVSGEIQKAEVSEGGLGEASTCQRGLSAPPQPLWPAQEPKLPVPSHFFVGCSLFQPLLPTALHSHEPLPFISCLFF